MATFSGKRKTSKNKLAPFSIEADKFDSPQPTTKKRVPFSFVLDELSELEPIVRPMFGFHYVYLDAKLVVLLRERKNQPEFNGLWIATSSENLQSLSEEFVPLPQRCIIDSGKNGWVFLPSALSNFESLALTACDLIKEHDRRIGGGSRYFNTERSM